MIEEELDRFIAVIRATPDVELSAAREQELRRELADLPFDEAVAAFRGWRLLHPERSRPAAGAIRAVWAEADLAAPTGREAADAIAAVYERERSAGGHGHGDHAALDALRRESGLLWRLASEWGGPPPIRPDRWRAEWLPHFDRVVERELRSRIAGRALGATPSSRSAPTPAATGAGPDPSAAEPLTTGPPPLSQRLREHPLEPPLDSVPEIRISRRLASAASDQA
jgi:hypothetical protein